MTTRMIAMLGALLLLAGCSSAEGQRAQELMQQAQVAQQALHSSTFEGGLTAKVDGETISMTFDGATSSEGEWVSLRASGIPGGGDFSAQVLRRGAHAWLDTGGGWQPTPVPPGSGANATMSSAAFEQLARYVEAVRVTEHQVVAGKQVTLIAGEIDTQAMVEALAKLGAVAGKAEGFSLDFDKLGIELGDIKAVLTIDEQSRLLDSALVTFSVDAQGKHLDVELRFRLTSANEPVQLPQP